MLLASRMDKLRTFRIRSDGRTEEGDPIPLRNSLFGHAFPGDEAALLRLELPEGRDFDGLAERLRLVNAIQGGVRGFRVLGGGHGVKDGKLHAATPAALDRIQHHFETAEDALAYGALLFSESKWVLAAAHVAERPVDRRREVTLPARPQRRPTA